MIALCVDDERLLLHALVRTVEKSPDIERAVGFDDEIDALDWAKKNPVDVAFLDIELHEMSGLELAQKLSALHPDISIIFCTGYEQYALRAIRLHLDAGYLVKPFRSSQIQEEIDHIKKKRRNLLIRRSDVSSEKEKANPVREIRIRMMGELMITVDGEDSSLLIERTKKGAVFLEYLILNRGTRIPKKRLLNLFWSDYLYANPDSALKTLVSRLRKTLSEVSEGLEYCVVSDAGGYYFNLLPGMSVDALQILDLYNELKEKPKTGNREEQYQKILELYGGDLYFPAELSVGEEYMEGLHRQYIDTVNWYLEDLMEEERYEQLIEVGRKAELIDPFDEKMHMQIMKALRFSGRPEDVKKEYERLSVLCRKHLNVSLSKEMQQLYRELVEEI